MVLAGMFGSGRFGSTIRAVISSISCEFASYTYSRRRPSASVVATERPALSYSVVDERFNGSVRRMTCPFALYW
jgi:hypothetical protein